MLSQLFGFRRNRHRLRRQPVRTQLAVESLEVRTTPTCTITAGATVTIACGAMGDTATIDHNDATSMAHLEATGATNRDLADSTYTRISYRSSVEGTQLNIRSNVKPVDTNNTGPSGGGRTAINVGKAGSMAGIRGTLELSNNPEVNNVTLDDSNDTDPLSATYSITSGTPRNFVTVRGFSPADVKMAIGDTGTIAINLGSGGADLTVHNTPGIRFGLVVQTNITTGGGGDDVRVFATSEGLLTVNLADGDSVTLGNATNQLSGITTPVTVNGSGAGPNAAGTVNIVDVGNSGSASYTATDTSFSSGTRTIVNFNGIGSVELWEATGAGTTLNDTHDPANYTLDIRTDDPPG